MNLYTIIKTLQETQGSKAKLTFLESHKENTLLKQYLKAVYDPAVNYYQKKVEKQLGWNLDWSDYVETESGEWESDFSIVLEDLKVLTSREITGDKAKKYLNDLNSSVSPEAKELLNLLLKRSIEAGVSDSTILKVFPDLYFVPPYQRCSLPDAKIIDKLNKEDELIVQQKLDGMFAYLVNDDGDCSAITRNGSKFTPEFAELLFGEYKEDCKNQVVIGEIIVLKEGKVLDRKTGNGILNSILQSGEIQKNYEYRLVAWDHLTVSEFKSGASEHPYCTRLENLEWVYPHIVEMFHVKTVEQAYGVYRKFLEQGHEGAVMKTKHFKWKNGTSKEQVKLKIEFECDLKVIGMIEGTGKYEGMMGSLTLASSDGIIVTDCGTGFSDLERKAWWGQYSPEDIASYNIIVTIKANDIIKGKGSNVYSMFLPVFEIERFDKTDADSYERCIEQLNAAKGVCL